MFLDCELLIKAVIFYFTLQILSNNHVLPEASIVEAMDQHILPSCRWTMAIVFPEVRDQTYRFSTENTSSIFINSSLIRSTFKCLGTPTSETKNQEQSFLFKLEKYMPYMNKL